VAALQGQCKCLSPSGTFQIAKSVTILGLAHRSRVGEKFVDLEMTGTRFETGQTKRHIRGFAVNYHVSNYFLTNNCFL
jgi:hypothetical protein